MPIKRKIRNLPTINDQMSFFDPVYQNNNIEMSDGENENDLLADGIPRPIFGKENKNESNETLDTDTIINSDLDQSSEMISTSKIIIRIREIQKSIHQARTMLESMEQFKNLVPDSDKQYEKLRLIIANLEEQQASYVNLLNLITLSTEERSTVPNRNSTTPMVAHDDDDDDDLSLRGNVRPRIESKIGFIPQAMPTVVPILNLSDNEQITRNDYSNYDSLVGSLKSDTIYWKDQQDTSDDDATDAESEKEMEKNLTLQKEQLRALQGQQRAVLALKRRSERHLIEQQQLTNKKSTNSKENDLLSDINSLRNRLKILRNRYEQKHQIELQQLKNSSKNPQILSENRLKNLEHVRERLDELEQIVTYYQQDEETPIQIDDTQRIKTVIQQKQQQITNNNPKQLDKLSSELTAKRLELEQAKSALNQLQQMVKKIQPDEYPPIAKKSPSKSNDFELCPNPTSFQQTQTETPTANTTSTFLSNILSPRQIPQPLSSTNNSVNAKMTAQHREIEHLVESRQRLHTIKGQIASLHQSMTTPTIPSNINYEDKLNDSRNIRPSYRSNHEESSTETDSELYYFELESDDDTNDHIQTNPSLPNQQIQSRIKQSNFCTSENMTPKHDELSTQMREICRCLSTFIEEQKSFNRHIEQRLTNVTNSPASQPTDPVFHQLQQQVLTQGFIVNLNTAYREIAVLQSEINALQSENTRLTSSISFDDQYHRHIPRLYSRDDSKESLYSFDQIKPNIRPRPRSKFDEQLKQQNHHLFENSSKTSFNSQSTGKQTAINVETAKMETTPIKQERSATFSAKSSSSSKPTHSKQISDIYDLPNHRRHSPKENLFQSFIIHRRPLLTDNQLSNHKRNLDQQSPLSSINNYQQHTADDDQQSNDFSKTVYNIQPSAYYTSTTQDLNNDDIQTLDLQVKSIMVQLIPFMRLHINEIFNQSLLNHIRERILFLFKQQPDSAQLLRQFQDQFSQLLEKTIQKYCGTTIRDYAADVIRDISDVAFDELVKYKIYENANKLQTTNHIEHDTQQDEYSHLYDPSTRYHTQEMSVLDDGENENKYQIELAESENRPLTLIGSDEEDNDSDQEESQDSELETAVSRQESNHHQTESPVSTESSSNGHEYVLVNRSTSNNIVQDNEEMNNS